MGENCSTCYLLLSLLFTYERSDVKPGLQRENFPGGTKVDAGPPNLFGHQSCANFFSDLLPNIVKFSPIFSTKLGENQEKKRSSLKFSPIFSPKLGDDQKKKDFTEI